MSRHALGLILAFVLLSAASVSLAHAALQPYTVDVSANTIATYAGKTVTYNATITSNRPAADTVDVLIRGRAKNPWVTLNTYSLDLLPEETKSFVFYVTPPYGTKQDTYTFDFTVASRANSTISVQKEVVLYVLEVSGLNVSTFKSAKNEYAIGEKVTILAGIKNTGTSRTKRTYMNITVAGATGAERIISVPPLEVDVEKIFAEDFIFDKYAAKGPYKATLELFNELGDRIGYETASFSVESRAIFEKEERAKSGLLYKNMEIDVTNNGNEVGTETIVQDAPAISGAYLFETAPSFETVSGENKMVWRCSLAPNESCTIRYEIRYWLYLLILAVAIGLAYFILREMEKPEIKKRHIPGKAEHTVHVEIKNKSSKILEEVEVHDFVPAAFEIIPGKFGTSVPVLVKRGSNGTNILWRAGKVAPGEERIFSYKFKTAVDVMGKIRLPHAKILARDAKGKVYRGISSKIVVE